MANNRIQSLCPPENDPLLANRYAENKRLSLAGSAFLANAKEDPKATEKAWGEFIKNWIAED